MYWFLGFSTFLLIQPLLIQPRSPQMMTKRERRKTALVMIRRPRLDLEAGEEDGGQAVIPPLTTPIMAALGILLILS